MKKTIALPIIVLCVSGMLTSCGVMFGGSKYTGSIMVRNHPQAKIYVNGTYLSKGTAIGLFPRNKPLAVELRQNNCETQTSVFNNRLRVGTEILSLLNFGATGVLVDIVTGAAYKPDHKKNKAIEKMGIKNFVFIIEYEGCPEEESDGN